MDAILRSVLAAMPDDAASVKQIVRSVPADRWPQLFEAAIRHGVSGLLEPYLDGETIPPPVWKAFLLHNTDDLLSYQALARSLEEIVQLLDSARVRVYALKGPALASRLYDNPATRVSTDLDLLIAPADLDRALVALRGFGYAGGSNETTSYLLQHSHHLDLNKAGASMIELHFQSYVGFGMTLPASALMDRAVEYAFTKHCQVMVPSPEDELLYLAVHAAGHSFVRLAWLYDMKMLLRKHPHLNWDAVASRSADAGVSTAVGFAVQLLIRWLGLPLDEAARKFRSRGLRVAVASAMLGIAARETDRSAVSNLKGLLFTALLCDRTTSAVWLVQHHILRSVRRRAHRVSPERLPASWAG